MSEDQQLEINSSLSDSKRLLLVQLSPDSLITFSEANARKGDFVLAKRALYQCAVFFPDFSARLGDQLAKVEQIRQDRLSNTHALPARRFDYLVLPSLMASSSLVELALNLHPQCLSVSKPEIDQALMYNQGGGLLNRHRLNLTEFFPEPKRLGIIVHRFLMRKDHIRIASQNLRGLLNESNAGQNKVVHNRGAPKVIQIVREPVSAFISDFNHQFISSLLGDYRFDALGVSEWSDAGVGQQTKNALEKARTESESFFVNFARDKILYHSIAQEFGKFFPELLIIESATFNQGSNFSGLSQLYSTLGLDANYSNPLFARSIYGVLERVMERNWYQVKLENHNLSLRIAHARLGMLSPSANLVELAHCVVPAGAPLEGNNLALCVSLPQWESLPHDLRIKLVQDGTIQRSFEAQILPAWLECWRRWQDAISPFCLTELTGKQRQLALAGMREDLLAFSKVFAGAASWSVMSEF